VSLWQVALAEAREDRTLLAIGFVLVVSLLVRLADPEEAIRLRTAFLCVGLHVLLLPAAGVMRAGGMAGFADVRLVLVVLEVLAVISAASLLLFAIFLPRIGVRSPRILRDVFVAAATLVSLFVLASRTGFNLSGLIATSAVLTAVVGLSFQDTLGNVMAGLTLHLDRSVRVGDWVKVTDLSGQVTEIGWRATSVETRNWETMVIPNSMLVRNMFLVLGRREGRPVLWRRWVYFNVDFRFHPGDVMDAVTEAVRAAPIEHVAIEPPPQGVLMDLHDSYGRYAVRYWLTDLGADDPTDSAVRTRIYFALRRAGIPLSMPAHAVFLTKESAERKAAKSKEDADHRREALAHIDLFDHLSEEDHSRPQAFATHPSPRERS
jgi:small-conductance mechanosensitive channel